MPPPKPYPDFLHTRWRRSSPSCPWGRPPVRPRRSGHVGSSEAATRRRGRGRRRRRHRPSASPDRQRRRAGSTPPPPPSAAFLAGLTLLHPRIDASSAWESCAWQAHRGPVFALVVRRLSLRVWPLDISTIRKLKLIPEKLHVVKFP